MLACGESLEEVEAVYRMYIDCRDIIAGIVLVVCAWQNKARNPYLLLYICEHIDRVRDEIDIYILKKGEDVLKCHSYWVCFVFVVVVADGSW